MKNKPWEEYGISKRLYYRRKRLGIQFDVPAKTGRPNRSNKRYSGKYYENPPEKLDAIREKYKDGVTLEIIEDWINNL